MTARALKTSSSTLSHCDPRAPFYHLVPKGWKENAQWRIDLIRMGSRSAAAANLLRTMCKRDPLFFLNSFVLLYEPRTEPPDVRQCSACPYQDRAIRRGLGRSGKTDIGVAKSRDMGASWLFLALFLWRWLFFPMGDYMIMSRKEEEVDSTENRKALMVK